ncbi:MAG: GNAT family N-acetyltransferase [Intrasporangiaceae bacterium]|nr:GNAT family N-acetyltransferase [Intrasporangiaceae bacterium]
MSIRHPRPDVHLRVLVADDADWVVTTDEAAATALARPHGWEPGKLAAELDEGMWASDDRWGWAIIVGGEPGGFALVQGLADGDARMRIRIRPGVRGRGAGREVLRQLADHHFSASSDLTRLTGRAHEHNVPMQRVFNAAGFRMEARYRDSFCCSTASSTSTNRATRPANSPAVDELGCSVARTVAWRSWTSGRLTPVLTDAGCSSNDVDPERPGHDGAGTATWNAAAVT